MTLTARSNLAELRREHERRLQLLGKRAAREGDDTSPAVLTEIEDIQAKIAEIDHNLGVVAAAPVSSDVADALGPAGRYQVLYSHIMRLDGDIGRIARQLELLQQQVLRAVVFLAAVLVVGFVSLGVLVRL
jgi:hypothetical protein